MNKNQRLYFDRQIKLEEIGTKGQATLLDSKILIIGVGGLGCSVASSLVRSGIGQLTLVDYDLVDTSNLHRQCLFDMEDIGLPKVEVAAKKLIKIAPWLDIEPLNKAFNPNTATEIFNNHDLIIDCTDNLKTKFFIHDFSFKNKTNLVQASIHKFDGQLQSFLFAKNIDKGCLRCLWNEEPSQIGSCNDNGVLGVVPELFGTLQATEALKILLNFNPVFLNEVKTIDLLSLEIDKFSYTKRNNCSFCNNSSLSENTDNVSVYWENINKDDYNWIDITSPMSIDEIIEMYDKNVKTSKKAHIVICKKGISSLKIVNKLRKRGYNNFFSMYGGTEYIDKTTNN